ncbi:MAG TPA: TAXI family TRAP transporter solute-binding subunit, partial [Stellaceae bacterium]|nr:TAXI family TRAP transporter solute-binding subunit [Stellaceae bacterium]
QSTNLLRSLGLDQQVQLIDIDGQAAREALLQNQVAGIALAGAFPSPAVFDLARTTRIRILGLNAHELALVLENANGMIRETIPGGTYPGVEEDTGTIAKPAGAYTTSHMSEAAAYAITKAFWTQKAELADRHPPWESVTPDAIAGLMAALHPGARRYYREAGVKLGPTPAPKAPAPANPQ